MTESRFTREPEVDAEVEVPVINERLARMHKELEAAERALKRERTSRKKLAEQLEEEREAAEGLRTELEQERRAAASLLKQLANEQQMRAEAEDELARTEAMMHEFENRSQALWMELEADAAELALARRPLWRKLLGFGPRREPRSGAHRP
ncbi:MAG: hypothetical protein ACRDM7_10865 [Thermoleophilaceae bacterium]